LLIHFRARERDDTSYALCVSHEGTVKHYRIDVLSSGEFAIQDGHKFPSIMSVSAKTDFLCILFSFSLSLSLMFNRRANTISTCTFRLKEADIYSTYR